MNKEKVHNVLEAQVLIEESFSQGTEEKYNECKFYTHFGELLFTARIELVGYYRDLPCGASIYKEL